MPNNRSTRNVVLWAALATLGSSAVQSQAAFITWRGTSSNQWGDPANWSPATVPGPNDAARFDNQSLRPASIELGSDRIVELIFDLTTNNSQTLVIGSQQDVAQDVSLVLRSGTMNFLQDVDVRTGVVLENAGFFTSGLADARIRGPISDGGRGLSLRLDQTWELNAPNTFSGITEITGFGDIGNRTLLNGNGSFLNSPQIVISGGLTLSNSLIATNRIADQAELQMEAGGIFSLGGDDDLPFQETVGQILLNHGRSRLSVGGAAPTTLFSPELTRDKGVASISGTFRESSRIRFASPPTAVGADGARGSTTQSIVPFLIGDLAPDSQDRSLVMYDRGPDAVGGNDDDGGLRPLLPNEFTTYEAAAAQDNVRIAASLSGVSGKAINSLVLGAANQPAANLNGIGGVLSVNSGVILMGESDQISGFEAIDFGSREGFIHICETLGVIDEARIAVPIRGSGGLTIASGRATLDGPSEYTGNLVVGGILQINHPSAAGSGAGSIILDGGELRVAQSMRLDRPIQESGFADVIVLDDARLTLGGEITAETELRFGGRGIIELAQPILPGQIQSSVQELVLLNEVTVEELSIGTASAHRATLIAEGKVNLPRLTLVNLSRADATFIGGLSGEGIITADSSTVRFGAASTIEGNSASRFTDSTIYLGEDYSTGNGFFDFRGGTISSEREGIHRFRNRSVGLRDLSFSGPADYLFEQTVAVTGTVTLPAESEFVIEGTLRGSGRVQGQVMIEDGGVLLPTQGTTPLTLNSLTLADEAITRMSLRAPEASNNPSTSIEGNLILDGRLEIDPLASFGKGTYRLFNYGTLTDLGLSVTGPAGFEYSIDTSTPGQVNLIVVPEPACAAIGLLAFAIRRRRE